MVPTRKSPTGLRPRWSARTTVSSVTSYLLEPTGRMAPILILGPHQTDQQQSVVVLCGLNSLNRGRYDAILAASRVCVFVRWLAVRADIIGSAPMKTRMRSSKRRPTRHPGARPSTTRSTRRPTRGCTTTACSRIRNCQLHRRRCTLFSCRNCHSATRLVFSHRNRTPSNFQTSPRQWTTDCGDCQP